MATEFKLPHISDGVESAQVSEVLVSVGDELQEGDSIIAIDTDKASVEVPITESGKIKEIKINEGDEVKVGDVILILESINKKEEKASENEDADNSEEDSKQEEDKAKENDKNEKEEKELATGDKADEEEKSDEDDKETKDKDSDEQGNDQNENKKEQSKQYQTVAASPSVRRAAREMGVDIGEVKGSGEQGRISLEDVKAHADKGVGTENKDQQDVGGLPDFSQWGTIDTKPLSSIRKATAKNMTAAWDLIPHVTQFDEADITDLEKYRAKLDEKAAKDGVKITVTALLSKLVVNALIQFPQFNASLDLAKEMIIYKKYYHIGIAVDTPKGLLVPVLQDVDKKNLAEIAVEIQELAEKARNGKLKAEEMQGGTFVISNLGGLGGTSFTPIVYHPQVAILGVSRTSVKPVFIEGEFQPREIIPLSLSYDHRAIDGADGARFLRRICDAIEDPYKAILGV